MRLSQLATIATHSGHFQADEAMGVWLVRRLAPETVALLRTRDATTLDALRADPAALVLDVGGVYDDDNLAYDHHQRGFFETFDAPAGSATSPETATGKYLTKLSASGLVYKHHGRDVLATLAPTLKKSPEALDWVYDKMYKVLMESVDAIDNGVEISDGPKRYSDPTGLSSRVGRLNKRWNEADDDGPSEDERFESASALCGAEFAAVLSEIVEAQLPAREVVEGALLARADVDASGQIVKLPAGGLPWKSHLYELEDKYKLGEHVRFVLYTDAAGMWRVQAVTKRGTQFTNRLGLPEAWRGVRDEALSSVTGIAGSKFCHVSGFIGGNETYEGALAMARAALRQA